MRKIKHALLFIVLFSTASLQAQLTEKESQLKELKTDTISKWHKGGITSLAFGQTALFNWAAGGDNSISLNALLNLYARYASPKWEWDNRFDFGYGFMNQSVKGFSKTDDRIEITSKIGRKAFSNFYYTGLINFRTQLFEGFDYKQTPALKISDILSPGYGVIAIGLNYKPSNNFSAFLSPITSKSTFVLNDSLSDIGAFGVDEGKNFRQELGGYFRATYMKNDFKSEFLKNLSIVTRLDLFSNYLKNPEKIDVNWDVVLGMKVNKYLSLSVIGSLIYDYDTKIDGVDKVQFKEIFGVGFSYSFKN